MEATCAPADEKATSGLFSAYQPQLDGLRFLCFMGVFICHCSPNIFWIGGYGLPCFFVVTGWLITGLLLEFKVQGSPAVIGKFYVRRFLRVFPAFYFVLTTVSLLGFVPFRGWHYACLFNVKLFLMSLQYPDGKLIHDYIQGWVTSGIHFWSVQLDEQYYLLYPLLVYFVAERLLGAVLFALLVVCIGISAWLRASTPQAFYGALFPVSGEYILLGCLAAWIYTRARLSARVCAALTYAAAAGLLAMFTFAKPAGAMLWLIHFQATPVLLVYGVLFAALVTGLWGNSRTFIARTLSVQPFPYLGKIAFGLYLIHLFMWPVAARLREAWLPSSPYGTVFEILARFSLTIAGATLMWHGFEKRINGLKKKFGYASRAPRAVTVNSNPAAAV